MSKKRSYKSSTKKDRKLRKKSDREASGRKKHRSSFWRPIIKVDRANASEEFTDFMNQKLAELPYNDPKKFPKKQRDFYVELKRNGYQEVAYRYYNGSSSFEALIETPLGDLISHLGEVLLSQLSEDEFDKFFPFNAFDVIPSGNALQVHLYSLSIARSQNGEEITKWSNDTHRNERCYHSLHKPRVGFDSDVKVVAFSHHALRRICERITPNWRSYWGQSLVFHFLHNCMFFEPTNVLKRNRNGMQRAISFYGDCHLENYYPELDFPAIQYFLQVEGISLEKLRKHWHYRIGYCPVEFEERFAVAITFLPPGFGATPEHQLLQRSDLDSQLKRKWLDIGKSDTNIPFDTIDFQFLKWCHDNGIPQVQSLPPSAFLRADGKPSQNEESLPINNRDLVQLAIAEEIASGQLHPQDILSGRTKPQGAE